MIILTEAAKRGFRTLRPDERPGVLRLDRDRPATNNESRLAVYLAEPEEGDGHIEHEGQSLLYVSRMVSAAYDGCVVDLVETRDGVGFAIGPPEETDAHGGFPLEEQA